MVVGDTTSCAGSPVSKYISSTTLDLRRVFTHHNTLNKRKKDPNLRTSGGRPNKLLKKPAIEARKQSTARLEMLPDELLLNILDFVQSPDFPSDGKHDLLNLCLTSHRLYGVAERCLYTSVSTSSDNTAMLMKTLLRDPPLGDGIKVITYTDVPTPYSRGAKLDWRKPLNVKKRELYKKIIDKGVATVHPDYFDYLNRTHLVPLLMLAPNIHTLRIAQDLTLCTLALSRAWDGSIERAPHELAPLWLEFLGQAGTDD